jgi:hypothetical protein
MARLECNVWYYAEGEMARGPMTLEELTSALSLMSQSNRVFVWRPGFESWQPAEDVKEVAASLFKPPPLKVEAPRKPLEQISAAKPHAYDTALANRSLLVTQISMGSVVGLF